LVGVGGCGGRFARRFPPMRGKRSKSRTEPAGRRKERTGGNRIRMQAQAVVATQPRRVAFQSVTVPDPGPEDVVVRIRHSWISNGTEGSFVRGERIAGDTPRKESDPLPFPHVPGYQKVGVVEWAGAEVGDIRVGDVVFATVSRVEEMFYPFGGHV